MAVSEMGMIGVFLNSSTGRNSMKFRGSSASIEPGIDRLTMNQFLTRSRYLESAVSMGKNSRVFCSILVSGVVDPYNSSSFQKAERPVVQSLYELQTVMLRACMMFWLGVSSSSTKSGSMQGGKCQFLSGTRLQNSSRFQICFSSSFLVCSWVGSLPRILSISDRESSSDSLRILSVFAKLK